MSFNGIYSSEEYSRFPFLLRPLFRVSLVSVTVLYYGEGYFTGESIERVVPFEGI